jgi:hypothetical protein
MAGHGLADDRRALLEPVVAGIAGWEARPVVRDARALLAEPG